MGATKGNGADLSPLLFMNISVIRAESLSFLRDGPQASNLACFLKHEKQFEKLHRLKFYIVDVVRTRYMTLWTCDLG